jgi:hypothetical protein
MTASEWTTARVNQFSAAPRMPRNGPAVEPSAAAVQRNDRPARIPAYGSFRHLIAAA